LQARRGRSLRRSYSGASGRARRPAYRAGREPRRVHREAGPGMKGSVRRIAAQP
jgi:hypothetical protein